MFENKMADCLQQFQNAKNDDDIMDVFNPLCNLILADDVRDTTQQGHKINKDAVNLLTNMENTIKKDRLRHCIKSFNCIYAGDLSGYFKEIELWIKGYYKDEKGGLTYESAHNNVLSVIRHFASDDNEFNLCLKKLLAILKKNLPETAFCAYVDYLTKKYQNPGSQIKALQQILDIDKDWYAVHVHLADVYYTQKNWQEAIKGYEAAVLAGEIWRTAPLYFALAWCYDKTRQYAKSAENYEQCLKLAPNYPYANNNLGLAYQRLKEYGRALEYFDKSLEHGTDGSYPIRNKLETLIKAKRNDEAIAFALKNPANFKSKYYRDLLEKAGEKGIMGDIDTELQKSTENENAGTEPIVQGNSGVQLYTHQLDAIRDMNHKILNKDRYSGLLVLPTGGGKTLTATYWLMGNILDSGKKVIWLAHRHELLNQAYSGFKKVSYADIARRKKQYNYRIISGQHDKPVHIQPSDDVLIASKTSLYRGFSHLSEKWLSRDNKGVFLVVDEAHHATAKEYRELINKIREFVPSVKVLGLTATPFRTADSEQGLLKKIFYDDIAYKIDLRELINRGILAEPIFEEVETEIDMIKLFQTRDGAEVLARIEQDSFFDIDSIGTKIATDIAENAERNNVIVSKYIENKEKYGQTLVFALNVTMAIALNKVFKDHGVKSDFVVSDVKDMATGVTLSSKENPEKIQKFREGKLNVLINVNILTEGTDLPKVQTVFLTRPTKSTILMTQMIGRALRGEKAGGTKDCYIVSFVDDWQSRIAWVNPERLFIDENADFNDLSRETRNMAMRLVAIQKIEEFAAIANGTIDERLERINFIERIPVGLYKFSYLVPMEDDEDEVINCDVLVYDCMQKMYGELFDWLPTADLRNVEAVAQHINDTLFTETDRLIGYNRKDIVDIINYYKQTEELPEFIAFTERDDYDVKKLAQRIISEPANEVQIMNDEWNSNNSRWSAFFGINNFTAFRMAIRREKDKLQFPDGYEVATVKPIAQHEQRQIQDLPLYEIRQKFPELGEKIRTAVFDKFTDANGYYYCVGCGLKSKRKLDFHVDHIRPMSEGGKTVPENLQLLCQKCNRVKGNKETWMAYNRI